ncbi:3-deoxy-D-manno-octulosonic acid transferase [Mucilaginibacter rubeus]|uniref:3-deoxy-D-manno-octulosonic acid transferase n=2 Tax=Sphingobacteriaceae TaxID=84566 RepID=A0AAE6JMC4_9SPHI|nr:glycosyltransferase N-terminal domain-containing protein [Mucilaginibacter rubeus]QEM20576.1 3-deoxy-D-manno-octulosonic acid transferase [Mucilaginibacter gossypii]QEM08123.1 3-deoxy-D-manno-octulosonic acid transferase [Mucilaginibacter rubeus]QTE42701.1 3-deoxy-D-manno-octulosonic acid transferase [Mucilaginibacter rubeus]QTE49302.1 3-deoxy-D-manno-octulosonic acid transferase [Mucilaginibacter rubeus]QTE54398.1 3-deoxy-D-manno-octulosonic acid transferase [Mucilaginibacter rubeus]
MMLLYNIGIKLYSLFIRFAALFNNKAKLWVAGRKNPVFVRIESSIWFHFASLGEFEQGRPILEAMRNLHPKKKIVVTFFSPSGYEIRKNTPLADYVYYLPLDTARNARRFIDAINPEIVIFTKYEYWFHFFNEANKRNIPLYIVSGIFRLTQVFFKWYGGFNRRILSLVSHFFLQDEASVQLLKGIGITNTSVSGDTRFDRVWANAQNPKVLPLIQQFKNGHKLFIAGSTWPQDENILTKLVSQYPDWKFIFAPHEIPEEKINNLIELLPQGKAITFSQLRTEAEGLKSGDFINQSLTSNNLQSLVIDNIGMLSSLYAYADVAYIGGGFGVGIHNTLEAAAFGLPVIFGPNYQKFNEARELIAIKAGFSISNETELKDIVDTLVNDEAFYNITRKKVFNYVKENVGATDMIMKYIDK